MFAKHSHFLNAVGSNPTFSICLECSLKEKLRSLASKNVGSSPTILIIMAYGKYGPKVRTPGCDSVGPSSILGIFPLLK